MEWRKLDMLGLKNPYEISEYGHIKKLSRKSIAKYADDTKETIVVGVISQKGYRRICLGNFKAKKKWYYIHRLVGFAFIPPVEGKNCINHKDGNKQNNHYTNLEWCTDAENNEHGFKTGLLKRGRNIKPYISKKTEWGTYKPVIDLETGIFYKVEELAPIIGTSQKYFMKMLRGDRVNRFPRYRYA